MGSCTSKATEKKNQPHEVGGNLNEEKATQSVPRSPSKSPSLKSDKPKPKDLEENEENPLFDVDLDIDPNAEPVKLTNGIVYTGSWRNGKQHGVGKQEQDGGTVYVGQYRDGRIEGFGRLTRPDGSTYEGEFSNGLAQTSTRKGVYRFKDGSKYVGEWKADRRHGIGKESLADGTYYEGEFVNGLKHGHGKLVCGEDVYEGEFKNGAMSGFGIYTWPDKRRYEGFWELNKMHGKGKFFFPSGKIYDGDFQDHKMTGKAKITESDGTFYEGETVDGVPNGLGYAILAGETEKRWANFREGRRIGAWLDPPSEIKDVNLNE